MDWAVVSYAFVVGMAATVNPCGAAMLPAYLGWFTRSGRPKRSHRVGRAVASGIGATLGFVVVFGVAGGLVAAGLGAVMDATPYVGIAVGVALVVVGVLSAVGRPVGLHLPGSGRALGGPGRGPRAVVGFGVSYGLASLGCALPVFLAGVTSAFTRVGPVGGVAAFLAYALGMGAVLTALAVVVAVAPGTRLRSTRAAGSWLQRPAGVLLVAVGVYIVYYWVVGGLLVSRSASGPIAAVDAVTSRLEALMSPRMGIVLAALVAVVGTAAWLVGRRRPGGRWGGDGSESGPTTPASRGVPEAAASGGSWWADHPRLRRARPFAAVGLAGAAVEAALLGGLVGPGGHRPGTAAPAAVASTSSPVSAGVEATLGLDWLPAPGSQPAPFALTDQRGRRVSLASLRGRAVVLTFNDNHGQELSPLYAADVRAAVADLGPLARRVAFVGVDVNPFHPAVASDVAFDRAEGLAGVKQWYFLTGTLPSLEAVWRAYGEQPTIGPHHVVEHDSSIRFIGPHGVLRAVGAYGPSSADTGRWGYDLATVAEALLGAHTPLAARTALTPPASRPTAAAGFSLPNAVPVGPRRLTLAGLAGHPVVLNFFASWCSACRAEATGVEAAARRYAGKVDFVGVDVNDTRASLRRYVAGHHLSYPVGFDARGSAAAAYGVTGLPTTVFISATGSVVARHVGGIGATALDRQLAGMSPGS